MMKTKNTLLTALTISASLLLSATPSHASNQSGSSSLAGIMDWFNDAKESVENYAKTTTQKLAGIGKEFEQIAQQSMGELGLVDPAKARSVAENSVNPDSAIYKSGKAANTIDRQGARASGSSILSEEGQAKQVQAYELTGESVKAVAERAQAAQRATVTQNVMKEMALQNAKNAELLGGVHTDLLKMNEQSAQSNIQLSNISESVDGQTASKNAEHVGAGYTNLETASKARLF